MIKAMGKKIFKHIVKYLKKKYASMPAFCSTSVSDGILKTVQSHLNGLLGGGFTLFFSGTRNALGWLYIGQLCA